MTHKKIISAIFLMTAVGCTKPQVDATPALPQSWIQSPARSTTPQAKFEEPSAAVDDSVRTQFAVHTAAFSQLTPMVQDASKQTHQKDWVPWHVDGMVVNFAIDVGGMFGALASDGSTSVKVTWQKPPEKTGERSSTVSHVKKPKQHAHAGRHQKSLQFSSSMSVSDVDRLIEPAIRSAIATHAVANEPAMRRNLHSRALGFLDLVKVLDGVPASRVWHVDSLQLQLTVDVQGNVSSSVAAGAEVDVYLDWQKSDDREPGPGAIREGPLFQSVANFAKSMSALIPGELLDSREIRASGFSLDQFQVGVAIIAGVHLAVANAQGEVQGKIVFKNTPAAKVADKPAMLLADVSEVRVEELDPIPMVGQTSTPQILFADQIGSASSGWQLFQVSAANFRQGLLQAIHMGSYFAKRAHEADTTRWNVTQIETEFDASIGGAFSIVTVNGQGQFLLDFDKPNE